MKLARCQFSQGQQSGNSRGQQTITLAQALAEDLAAQETPMKRYVHTIPVAAAVEEENSTLCQLRELNQILDYQNKILAELLKSVDRLTQAAAGRAGV